MTGTARRDWLKAALALLEEVGVEALTIERLTKRLDVTKGSLSGGDAVAHSSVGCLLI